MSPGIDADGWGELLKARKCAPYDGPLPPAAIAAAQLEAVTPFGSHRFAEHRRCGRAHALRYRDRIVPRERLFESDRVDYFALGSTIHAALAYCWEGFKLGEERRWRDALYATTLRGDLDEDVFEEADRLLSAYWGHYGERDWSDDFEILEVEKLLTDGDTCPVCGGTGRNRADTLPCFECGSGRRNPDRGRGFVGGSFALPYTARLDLIGRNRLSGEIVIVDTKTRAKAFPTNRAGYQRDLSTREQFLGQAHLVMKAFGLSSPPVVVVNAIMKKKVPEFDRLSVPLRLEDVERWREAHARDAAAGLGDDRMNYSSCAPEIGSRCGYFLWCHGSEEERQRHYQKREE